MEKIIMDMIQEAERNNDYELIKYVKRLIDTMATTINCPSNWRYIAERLCDKYNSEAWVYEMLELWNYGE